MSVGQGTALSITLEAIDISLFDVSDTGEEVGASSPGLPYRVAVHVAPGTRASYLQPPVLRAVTSFLNGAVGAFYGTIDLNGASTAVYPVPLNAGVDSVEILAVAGPTGQPSTEVSVSCMAGGDTTKYWNASQREGFVKLPPGTTHVVLTNLTPSESAVTQVVTLTWGIEG